MCREVIISFQIGTCQQIIFEVCDFCVELSRIGYFIIDILKLLIYYLCKERCVQILPAQYRADGRIDMWKQKLGISLGNHYSIPTEDIIKIAKAVGFDAISPEWEKDVDLDAVVTAAKECELYIQSLHAPFGGSANMWSGDINASKPALEELLQSLEACHKYNIPILVAHAWIGFDNISEPTEVGFQNYGRLIEKAAEYGIKIALENTEGEEYLFALMDRFKDSENVGFCWDSGHEMCYNHSVDLLARYGGRLIMTHLNDNLGISRFDGKTFWTDDLHLLPFDGVADWDYNVRRLKTSNRLEFLNFELNIHSKPNRHENDCYEKLTLEEYFTEAYKRACKVAYKFQFV